MVKGERVWGIEKEVENHKEKYLQHVQRMGGHKIPKLYVQQSDWKFEVFTAVTMKNVVFWDVTLCKYFVNRCFGWTFRLHLQGIRNPLAMNQREQYTTPAHAASSLADFLNPEDRGDTFVRYVG
jgi:hypothetical protein